MNRRAERLEVSIIMYPGWRCVIARGKRGRELIRGTSIDDLNVMHDILTTSLEYS